jgi:hypothetical protein
VTDDPLFGEGDEPPIVPMNNAEVVEFDALRGIMRMSPRRRRLVLGGILAASLLVVLVAIFTTSSTPPRTETVAAAEHEALVSDCSRLRADEKAYASGTLTQEFFDRDLFAMMSTPANLAPVPPRLENDLETIENTLVNSDAPAGPALNDAHRLCATSRASPADTHVAATRSHT